MLVLLRKNQIANPEKLLLELVDESLTTLDLYTKGKAPTEQDSPKLNKVSSMSDHKRAQLHLRVHQKFEAKS